MGKNNLKVKKNRFWNTISYLLFTCGSFNLLKMYNLHVANIMYMQFSSKSLKTFAYTIPFGYLATYNDLDFLLAR